MWGFYPFLATLHWQKLFRQNKKSTKFTKGVFKILNCICETKRIRVKKISVGIRFLLNTRQSIWHQFGHNSYLLTTSKVISSGLVNRYKTSSIY